MVAQIADQMHGPDTMIEAWDSARMGAPVPARGTLESQLERLKRRLLKPILARTNDPVLAHHLASAANEAAALAWYTGFPILFLPGLMEEKLAHALRYCSRQQQIWAGRPTGAAPVRVAA